ncbi:MAG: DUF2752 domain-containing protein [Thermoanaerobaculia bacterium]|nr:DUF2752 domain-containing protein [Thermoanaerobaculia bacterium]
MRLALWLAVGFGAGLGLWFLGQVAPAYSGPEQSLCLLRRAGIPCPNCGMTRALGALGRGDLDAAQALHPLAVVFLTEGFILWVFSGVQLARRRHWPSPTSRQFAGWLAAHAVALVALWLGRSATGTVPW